ncbi:MAG: hypothetical protein GTN64_07440 [Candidatus Latescibacteria bacterium]|nr:hypothetical protein [Candidatus Latescibacterota bacterium]NIO78436.1 hypothetical protein [Candidatus Latescibacterota bacterium]
MSKKPNRFVIVCQGGTIQTMAADDPELDIIIIDWDNIQEEFHADDEDSIEVWKEFVKDVPKSGSRRVNRILRDVRVDLKEMIQAKKA